MKIFCKDGKINTIAKNTHPNVDGFEALIVPDDFDVILSRTETVDGVVTVYKTPDQIKQELVAT